MWGVISPSPCITDFSSQVLVVIPFSFPYEVFLMCSLFFGIIKVWWQLCIFFSRRGSWQFWWGRISKSVLAMFVYFLWVFILYVLLYLFIIFIALYCIYYSYIQHMLYFLYVGGWYFWEINTLPRLEHTHKINSWIVVLAYWMHILLGWHETHMHTRFSW